MPENIVHIRRQNRFMPQIVDRLFVVSNAEICRAVNQEKDCIKGRDHRVLGHGLVSNIPMLRKYGFRGFKTGIQHDLDDIRDSLGNPNRSKLETIIEFRKIARKRWRKRIEERKLFL